MNWRTPLGVSALALCAVALADELTPAKLAAVERDLQAASAQIDVRFGSRDAGQMTNEERGDVIREKEEAARQVLEKHGVDDKEYARRELKLSRDERALVDAEKARLDQEEADRRKAEVEATDEEVEVYRGVNENRPVDLYREPGQVPIESLAEGGQEGAEKPEEKKPPPPPSKKKRRR